MTISNVTVEDDSLFGSLGSYECHAFAVNVTLPKRHGFSVSVITSKSSHLYMYMFTITYTYCIVPKGMTR